MKGIEIEWLSKCNCDTECAIVITNGDENNLYEGDVVYCPNCFQNGEIWTDGENADVVWERE